MFALLINLLILPSLTQWFFKLLIKFWFFVTCFFFIFTREALPHRGLLYTIFCIAYSRICCGNLPWLFAAGICRRNLPWEFAAAVCRGIFVFVRKSFFVYVSKSCLYGSKPFLYVSKTCLFVRFSLLTVFLFDIVVAVMGHRSFQLLIEFMVPFA